MNNKPSYDLVLLLTSIFLLVLYYCFPFPLIVSAYWWPYSRRLACLAVAFLPRSWFLLCLLLLLLYKYETQCYGQDAIMNLPQKAYVSLPPPPRSASEALGYGECMECQCCQISLAPLGLAHST